MAKVYGLLGSIELIDADGNCIKYIWRESHKSKDEAVRKVHKYLKKIVKLSSSQPDLVEYKGIPPTSPQVPRRVGAGSLVQHNTPQHSPRQLTGEGFNPEDKAG
jgi:hypothetical protein